MLNSLMHKNQFESLEVLSIFKNELNYSKISKYYYLTIIITYYYHNPNSNEGTL